MSRKPFLTGLTLSIAALAFLPGAALAQDSAAAVLKRASAAMGAPNTIRYAGEGTGWTFGQAYKPGMPWPKIDIQSQARTINYATGSMREEMAFNRGRAARRRRVPAVRPGAQRLLRERELRLERRSRSAPNPGRGS